jgi:hypothetical protein
MAPLRLLPSELVGFLKVSMGGKVPDARRVT